MRHSASRSLFFIAFGACAWLALRPDTRVERALDVALAPTRVLGELCAPLTWLRARRVHAAESALEDNKEREYALRRELHTNERRAAEPTTDALRHGRRFIHVEVLDHLSASFDRVSVRVDGDDCSGIARGMPVTCGDAFIGRIIEVDVPEAGRAIVELATASTFAVGATLQALDGAPVHCVAGGMSSKPRKNEALLLSLSIPDRRVRLEGTARVDECLSVLARFAAESDGFELGAVEAQKGGRWAVRPKVDFRAGLFQLVIVAPESLARAPDVLPPDELADGAWFVARATSSGEPNAGREGLELAAGSWNGARDGAALVVGARLIGRIEHAGALTSDARLLGDPGFAVNALARLDDRDAPDGLRIAGVEPLKKPFEMADLLALVDTVLRRPATGAAG